MKRPILLWLLCASWPVAAAEPSPPEAAGAAGLPGATEAPAAPEVVPTEDGEAAENAEAAPKATPVPALAPVPIVGYELDGAFTDPVERLVEYLRAVVPVGAIFIPEGDADLFADIEVASTPLRLRRALHEIGYEAVIQVRPHGAGCMVRATVQPYDRVRYIKVHGNWPMREDEIQRLITRRPGQALPKLGAEREQWVTRERQNVLEFLRNEGYLDAQVGLRLVNKRGVPMPVDIHVDIKLGPGYPLGAVSVTGNKALSTTEIVEALRHLDWRKAWMTQAPFTRRRLTEDLQALTKRYRELGYPGARIRHDFDPQNPEKSVDRNARQVLLNLTIDERKRVVAAFEGNTSESASTLRDELTIFKAGAYDDVEAQNSADALHKFYQQHGRLLARVSWRREALSPDQDRVVFIIHEGPELRVRSIAFEGHRAFSDETLAEVVTVREFPLLGALGVGEGGYATPLQIQEDAKRLTRFYQERGYLDAKVQGELSTARELMGHPGAQAAEDETTVQGARELHVRFKIVEGPLVRVKEVRFQTTDGSPLPIDEKIMAGSMALRVGGPMRTAAIDGDHRKLVRLLGDAGYRNAAVGEVPDMERHGTEETIVWQIRPGVEKRVGPVFVRGNYTTEPETILEQIPLNSGGRLTTTGVERGQRNLAYLQLFNNAATIRFPAEEHETAPVPMLVQVEERNMEYSVLHVGGGVSTEQKPPDSSSPVGGYLRVGYDNRNLLGHGWNLKMQLDWGTSLLRANSSFLDRRFFGSLFRFDISGNYLQQATVRLGDIRSGGGSIGFSREMAPGVDASVHYNLRNTTGTETLIKPSGANAYRGPARIGTTVGSLSATIQLLRLDNRLLPSKGYRLDLSAEMAMPDLSFGLGGDKFLKVGAHALVVVPLLPWLSLRYAARYDQGLPLGGASLLPRVERFFAGGDTTIRGYDLDRARVETIGASTMGSSLTQYHPIGGSLRMLQNVDLQFPIAPPWFGAVFIDSGILADSFDELPLRSFRHGAGIAPLQLKLPIGDISFAWAWPLNPGPGDTRIGRFHVNIGLMF